VVAVREVASAAFELEGLDYADGRSCGHASYTLRHTEAVASLSLALSDPDADMKKS